MTRISKLDPKDWDPEIRAMARPETATPLEQGLMRMFAHRPALAKGMMQFAGALKLNRTLGERLVELVRLRVAFHNQCRSCMAIRYRDAVADGVTEDLVCSLEKPYDAPDLTDAEKAALAYADAFATDHLAVNDATFDRLRKHFSEPQIIELGMTIAFFVGFGRLAATLDMVDELPERFQDHSQRIAPWGEESILVR
ncbi:MAG: carboxymuconolactone decarboxylase family protein [Deltaproteobacteria bacterium]|nr:carboxymuconolactone decarboxylase family protein [Deltaproteobacteria bacterium]